MPIVKAPDPCKVPVQVALSLFGALRLKLVKKAVPLYFSSPVTFVLNTIVNKVPASKSVAKSLKDCCEAPTLESSSKIASTFNV